MKEDMKITLTITEKMMWNKKNINEKLSKFPIHQLIKQIKTDELLWDFDGNSLYPSAMWDENSIYPRIETGYVFTPDMNKNFFEKFNIGKFTQGSSILKTKHYNPKKNNCSTSSYYRKRKENWN